MRRNPICTAETNAGIPDTQGVKFAGSKRQLLGHILKLVKQTGAKSVLDGFAGSTRVSQALAKTEHRVVSNDVSVWTKVFASCYLLNRDSRNRYAELIGHLNSLPPKNGWFTQHYGGLTNGGRSTQQDGLKRPWQIHNTRKLDAIREEIDKLGLPSLDKSVAITSLILALDRVDNTLGHFVSYLKDWSPRSFQQLRLEVPQLFANEPAHTVYRGDVFDVADMDVDLAYYDPPYGSNNEKMPPSRVRYASYYHLWTTVCLNDQPELVGKAQRRKDCSDIVATSVFEEFRRNTATGRFFVIEAIEKLIQQTTARWIVLSYSSGGRATAEELNEVLRKNGEIVDMVQVDHRRNVMAQMRWTNDWIPATQSANQEFLFLIEKV